MFFKSRYWKFWMKSNTLNLMLEISDVIWVIIMDNVANYRYYISGLIMAYLDYNDVGNVRLSTNVG